MNHTYSSLIPTDHSSTSCSRETSRLFDAPYTIYPSHSTAYPEYSTSKLEAFDYNHWPTTTHNLLAHPTNVILDQIPNASSTIETFVPTSSVNFSHLNSSAIPLTHHHHHIHQHLYPSLSSSPTCNESSPWLASSDYQSFDSTGNTSSYGHYSNYSANTYYDPPQSQWTSPSTNLPIKFESSHSSSTSCFDLSDGQEPITREDHPLNSISPIKHFKGTPPPPLPSSSSSTTSQLISIPPRNPMNGKTRTRDKYRIVYTEQQRHELENEFVTSKYISIPRKAALSLALTLSERQIKIWFQNRRAKERKLQKKRLENSSNRHLNNSNDGDSPSDGDFESPTYYPIYA